MLVWHWDQQKLKTQSINIKFIYCNKICCLCFCIIFNFWYSCGFLRWLSPGGGWLRSGCLSSAVLTVEVRAVVWPSGLGASSAVNHLPEWPGLHLWALGLEHPSLVETLRPPGPGRSSTESVRVVGTVSHKIWTICFQVELGLPKTPQCERIFFLWTHNDIKTSWRYRKALWSSTQCRFKLRKHIFSQYSCGISSLMSMSDKYCSIWACSYNRVGDGVIRGNNSCVHGRCGDRRVPLGVHGGGAGTQGRADSHTRQTLWCVFHRLTGCDGERMSEVERERTE